MKPKMWWFKRFSLPHLMARWLMLFATAGYIILPTSVVWANPMGEQVVGGAATFQREGSKLTINQATDRLAVNWQSFNIAAGEHTHFNMPSAASIALNRVLGGNPSDIRGTLTGNGTIIVANQFGISTAPGSVIKTGSLILTTKDVNPEQFMHADLSQGINLYGDSTASIVNQGAITAEKGDVFLIAQKVENRGTISAPNGKAALVGTGGQPDRTDVVLYEKEGSGFAVRVSQLQGEAAAGSNRGLPDGEELLNEGEIAAAQAELNASGNIYALAIRNSGTIRAKAVLANADGTVRLDGGLGDVRNAGTLIAKNAGAEATAAGGKIEVTGQNVTASPESIITAAGGEQGGNGGKVKIDSADTTIVQGKVDVTAPSATAKGGKVELLGERVGLFDGAKVDASGGAGGGTVLAGGDYLGGQTPKPEFMDLARQESEPVKNAKSTVMADTAEIKADAKVSGDGGKIILWSDEYTGFYGELFARGGMEGGNGGFIETSSKNNLQVGGVGWASADKGTRGLWLLDPINVSISSINPSFGGSLVGGTWFPSLLNSSVFVGDITTALQSTDVTITTAGTATDNNGAIVVQPGDITVGANITASGAGNLRLAADGSITVASPISIVGNVTLNSLSGSVSLVSDIQTSAGVISITAATSVTGGGALSALSTPSGSVSVNSRSGAIALSGGISSGTSITLSSGNGGDISLGGTISAVTTLSVNAGTDDATTSISINGGANVTANTINLNARNNITFNSGSSVTQGSGVFQLYAVNGNLSGDGDVQAASGIFDLRAGLDLVLGRLNNTTGGGVVTLNRVESAGGRIDVGTDDPITLAGGVSATSITGDDNNRRGDITLTSGTGDISQNRFSIQGGRIVTLNAGTSVVPASLNLGGTVSAGWRMDLNAANINLDTATSLTITTPNGSSSQTPGFGFGGLINSLRADPALAAGLSLDMRSRTGLVATLGGLVGSLRPLAYFSTTGGTLEFRATGASAIQPSISVVNPGNFPASGYLNFGGSDLGTDLVLYENTYLRSQGDMTFGGDVTAGFVKGNAVKAVFDLATVVAPGSTAPNGGQIIFQGGIGTAAAPIGQLLVEARGSRPVDPLDPASGLKDAQISVNGGIVTFPGVNPGNTGGVELRADGAVVITSRIDTSGGTIAKQTDIGGNVIIRSDLDGDGNANENIQLDGASLLTRGGFIQFDGDVYLVSAASINTTPGNSLGSITFNQRFDGVAPLTLDAGIAPVTFNGLVGSLTPAGLTVSRSGGITFNRDVTMGGTYDLSAEGEPGLASSGITFQGAVDGRQAMVLNSKTGDIIFKEAVGGTTEIASLTVGPGGLRTVGGIDKVYFFGDVTTAGTGAAGSSLISINKDVVIGKTGTFTFRTNARENVTGGNISFLGSLIPDAGLVGETDLVFQAGSGGSLVFNGNVGNLDVNYSPFGKNFQTIAVASAVGVGMGDGVVVYAEGRNSTDPAIKIDAGLSSFFPQGRITFRAGKGDIQILRGGDLSGAFAGAGNNTGGSKLLARVDGTGNITVGSLLNVSGGDNDTQATSNPGGPGFDSGYVFLYTESGVVNIGTISANGGASSGFGAGGSGLPFGAIPKSDLASIGLQSESRIKEIGAINFFGKNVIVNGALISNGGAGTTSIGGTGGGIQITLIGDAKELAAGAVYNETRASFRAGSIYANGGASQSLVGGDGGSVKILAESGFLVAPTTFALAGGAGANNAVLLAGKGGNVTIRALGGLAPGQEGDVYFDNTQFNLTGNGDISVLAGRNLALQYLKFNTTLDNLGQVQEFSEERLGGVVISMNQVSQGQPLAQNLRGQLNLGFSQSANGSYEYETGKTAGLYMPSNAYILTNGGDVVINGGSEDNNTSGNAVLSGISTSGPDVNGGNINIQNRSSVALGDVLLASSLETFGGTPLLPAYGRAGGSVTITGRDLNLKRIDTSGSASLAAATAPAIGGAGGNVSLTSSVDGKITLKRDLIASGGQGFGTKDATGGGGGTVNLVGNVVLASGDPTRPAILIDTTGGLGQGDGEAGQGGAITWEGPADALLQGTAANSNTLDLRYGSGVARIGSETLANYLTLGELITAANDARSTGTLKIYAALQNKADSLVNPPTSWLSTLTTYARSYNIEILGGGKVETPTTFLNTGYVQIGNPTVDRVTTFAGGINTQTGPAATVLAGKLQTSNEFLDTEASILLGAVELRRDSSLDTFGNTLALGSLDSITSSFDLTLLAGIGNGAIQLPGNIGAKAGQPSVLGDGSTLVKPGTLFLENPVDSQGNPITRSVLFGGTITAEGINSENRNNLEFRQDVNLSGVSDILGNVTLNNLAGGSNILDFNMGDGSRVAGNVSLLGGAASLGGNGDWEVSGAVNGSQNLTVQGTGTKTFGGLIGTATTPLGGPTGPSIQILADRVEFENAVRTRFGINSQVATTTAFLNGANVTTGGASQFLGTVQLNNMTFQAGGATRFSGLELIGGTVTLAGTGAYNTTGAVDGNGFNLTLGGTTASTKLFSAGLADLGQLQFLAASGATTFGGDVEADNIEQATGAGSVAFGGNVISAGSSNFRAAVQLGNGIVFTADGGTTTFLSTSTPQLAGNVTLAGAGQIIFNSILKGTPSSTLTLDGTGVAGQSGRTFNSALQAGNLLQTANAGLLTINQATVTLSAAANSQLRNALLNGSMLTVTEPAGTVEILGDVSAQGSSKISASGILLGVGNNLNSLAGGTFTLAGQTTLGSDTAFRGAGGYIISGNLGDLGGGFSLALMDGGLKSFGGNINVQALTQDDGSGSATFAGNVGLVGDGTLLGNVVLNGVDKTFRSTSGSLLFGNAGTDLLTVNGASVLGSDPAQIITVASQIRLNAQLGIETGNVFLNQVTGASSNLNLIVNDVNLAARVALGSGTMTVRTLAPITMSLGDNPMGLNLDKVELGLISTSGGLRINDVNGSGIFVDNVTSGDVAGITGPVRLLSPTGVVAFMSPSTLPKLGVAAQDVSGLNNATFQEISQLELVNPAADVNINAGGSMAISGPVAIGNGKNFNLTANGDVVIRSRVSSGGGVLINPQGGYFVNQSGGQVFDNATLNSVNGVRVVTRDLFTPNLETAFAQGLRPVFGVTDPNQLGRNQIGSGANFTDGNFAPYYFEFATGSAQPYIFAQQTAIPLVQFPPTLSFSGALPAPVSYSEEELEMLTPEERSNYEAQRRQREARVILQSAAGQQELGGGIPTAPQASRGPTEKKTRTPTAQVWLQGRPMAGNRQESDRNDTTRLLRSNGMRAVALRNSEVNPGEVLLAERISAEIDILAKPIASQR